MNKVIDQYISNVKKGLYNLVPSDNYLFDLRETLEEYIQQFPNSLEHQKMLPTNISVAKRRTFPKNWLNTEKIFGFLLFWQYQSLFF